MAADMLEGMRGCIFDYGGTLDTGGNHWGRIIWHSYERQCVPVSEDVFREAYVYAERELGRNPIIQSDYTFETTLSVKLKIQMEHIAGDVQGFDSARWHKAVLADLYNGVKKETARSLTVLKEMAKRMPMVLVSNFYGNLHTVLHEFGFDGLFVDVVESAVVGVRKPDPAIFSMGISALGMKADQVVVIGDSYPKDIVPAKKLGCRTVWIMGEGWTDYIGADASADYTIHSLGQLL